MASVDFVQNWQTYAVEVEGKPTAISVNMGLKIQAPVPELPYLLTVWIKLPRPDADGWPRERELSMLARIEESLESQVDGRLNGIFAGHQTRAGIRECYYYCAHTEGHAMIVSQAMMAFEGYAFGTVSRPDPAWQQYLEHLCPSPRIELSIRNRNTVDSLTFFGDPLEPARQIDHFLYFSSSEGRTEFTAAASALGFSVVRSSTYAQGEKMPFSLLIARDDSATIKHIDAVAHTLYDLAIANGGEYDGWESAMVEADAGVAGLAGNLLNKLSGN